MHTPQLIEHILDSSNDDKAIIALKLLHRYLDGSTNRREIPEGLTLRILKHPNFFGPNKHNIDSTMDQYHWAEVGKLFVHAHLERSLELVDEMLQHFSEDNTIM